MMDKRRYPESDPSDATAIVAVSTASSGQIIRPEATTDYQVIKLWLHGRSRHTQRAYQGDAARLMAYTPSPLGMIRLGDLQAFSDSLATLAGASRHRILSSIKSLFSFAHRLGYLRYDTAKALKMPPLRDHLSERILDEAGVQRMLALETNIRNAAVLYLLYGSGIRASELTGLRWSDVQSRPGGAQITVLGKGGKTRSILIPAGVHARLEAIRNEAADDRPVFPGNKKKPLSTNQILRIVKCAAKRAGLNPKASTHWLRHAHASHSLDRGCPISLVQTTLGHASVATTGRYLHARPNSSSSTFLPI
jgi:site-specific recombinase XerD